MGGILHKLRRVCSIELCLGALLLVWSHTRERDVACLSVWRDVRRIQGHDRLILGVLAVHEDLVARHPCLLSVYVRCRKLDRIRLSIALTVRLRAFGSFAGSEQCCAYKRDAENLLHIL